MDISRLDIGNAKLEEEEIDALDIIDACIRMLKLRADEAGITIGHYVQSDMPKVVGDKRLLTQALLNLLTNAVKFTKDGGSVTVGAYVATDGGVVLFVRDTGIGMKAADVERVGELFMQVDTTLSRKFEGTGLGLAIAKRLAESHGGGFLVESTLGEGTTVSIQLPPSRTRNQGSGTRRDGETSSLARQC